LDGETRFITITLNYYIILNKISLYRGKSTFIKIN